MEDNIVVTKRNLHKAVSLIYGDETLKDRNKHAAKKKWMRMCELSSLKAYNMERAAQTFNADSLREEILEELRSCFLKNENTCSHASKLIEWLMLFNSNLYLPVIWKSAVYLFLNHNQDCIEDFFEMCAEQRLPEQKKKLLEMLMTLPDTLGSASKGGSSSKHNIVQSIKTECISSEMEDDPL